MNQKHHVSLKIAKQLAEAGIVIESEYYWDAVAGGSIEIVKAPSASSNITNKERCHDELSNISIPAPIATEILERLPASIQLVHPQSNSLTTYNAHYWKVPAGAYVEYVSAEMKPKYKHCGAYAEAQNLPDALALLLIRLTKDGLI